MAFVDRSRSNNDSKAVVITFRSPRDDVPIWITTSPSDWQPVQMSKRQPQEGDEYLYEHTLMVPKDYGCIYYKFRIGDYDWVSDSDAPAVHDGFGGMNNRFDVAKEPESDSQPTKVKEFGQESTNGSVTNPNPGTETEQTNMSSLKSGPEPTEPSEFEPKTVVEERKSESETVTVAQSEPGSQDEQARDQASEGPTPGLTTQSVERENHSQNNGHSAVEEHPTQNELPASVSESIPQPTVRHDSPRPDINGEPEFEKEPRAEPHPLGNGTTLPRKEGKDNIASGLSETIPVLMAEHITKPVQELVEKVKDGQAEFVVEHPEEAKEAQKSGVEESAHTRETAPSAALGINDLTEPMSRPDNAAQELKLTDEEDAAVPAKQPEREHKSVDVAESQAESNPEINGAIQARVSGGFTVTGPSEETVEEPNTEAALALAGGPDKDTHRPGKAEHIPRGIEPRPKEDFGFSYAMYFGAAALVVAILAFVLSSG